MCVHRCSCIKSITMLVVLLDAILPQVKHGSAWRDGFRSSRHFDARQSREPLKLNHIGIIVFECSSKSEARFLDRREEYEVRIRDARENAMREKCLRHRVNCRHDVHLLSTCAAGVTLKNNLEKLRRANHLLP
jgi:hypothetical protein